LFCSNLGIGKCEDCRGSLVALEACVGVGYRISVVSVLRLLEVASSLVDIEEVSSGRGCRVCVLYLGRYPRV
jgi:uncharacterized UPF0146 family protein